MKKKRPKKSKKNWYKHLNGLNGASNGVQA